MAVDKDEVALAARLVLREGPTDPERVRQVAQAVIDLVPELLAAEEREESAQRLQTIAENKAADTVPSWRFRELERELEQTRADAMLSIGRQELTETLVEFITDTSGVASDSETIDLLPGEPDWIEYTGRLDVGNLAGDLIQRFIVQNRED